jgi:Rps23 Pro-64 3,4-dihydroxylase Tpa1-like proline 4-hydroxylase
MNSLIWSKQNSLTKEFCSHLIHKFEKDDQKTSGRVASGIDLKTKVSTDLMITSLSDWKEEDKVLYNALQKSIEEYENYCLEINEKYTFRMYDLDDTGYQIQRTCPGEYYHWHNDFSFEGNSSDSRARVLTFIWYLNDIHYDGETEFVDGTKINPETGKLIIFPATWTYLHRGITPKKEVKYICTGWIYSVYRT